MQDFLRGPTPDMGPVKNDELCSYLSLLYSINYELGRLAVHTWVGFCTVGLLLLFFILQYLGIGCFEVRQA